MTNCNNLENERDYDFYSVSKHLFDWKALDMNLDKLKNEFIESQIKYLIKKHNIAKENHCRLRAILERTFRTPQAKPINDAPWLPYKWEVVHFWPSIEEAIKGKPKRMKTSEVLGWFEKSNLIPLGEKELLITYLQNCYIPFYTKEELLELLDRFLGFLKANRKEIVLCGYPSSPFIESPWMNMLLSSLYPCPDDEQNKTHRWSLADYARVQANRDRLFQLKLGILELLKKEVPQISSGKHDLESLMDSYINHISEHILPDEFNYFTRIEKEYPLLTLPAPISGLELTNCGGIANLFYVVLHIAQEFTNNCDPYNQAKNFLCGKLVNKSTRNRSTYYRLALQSSNIEKFNQELDRIFNQFQDCAKDFPSLWQGVQSNLDSCFNQSLYYRFDTLLKTGQKRQIIEFLDSLFYKEAFLFIDIASESVHFRGRPLKLVNLERRLLIFLAKQPKKYLSTDVAIEETWPKEHPDFGFINLPELKKLIIKIESEFARVDKELRITDKTRYIEIKRAESGVYDESAIDRAILSDSPLENEVLPSCKKDNPTYIIFLIAQKKIFPFDSRNIQLTSEEVKLEAIKLRKAFFQNTDLS